MCRRVTRYFSILHFHYRRRRVLGFTKMAQSWAACLFKLLLASVNGRKVFGWNKRVEYWLSWNENEWTVIPEGN